MGGLGGMMGGMGGAGAEDIEEALEDVDVDADDGSSTDRRGVTDLPVGRVEPPARTRTDLF